MSDVDEIVGLDDSSAPGGAAWCTDITQHPARAGKIYCCAILDCFSKMIVAPTFSTTADIAFRQPCGQHGVATKPCRATTLRADHGSRFTTSVWHSVLGTSTSTSSVPNSPA
ncbi:DDE-type integrase/transposase/recombinase [uncultured Mycobacterium sp.]|uniref:DDE-type integrase/transposase/recombinase n=1 Tax=uncultured Mycobacterium sp. TaxID=171292 RepID=UPI0035CB16E9